MKIEWKMESNLTPNIKQESDEFVKKKKEKSILLGSTGEG